MPCVVSIRRVYILNDTCMFVQLCLIIPQDPRKELLTFFVWVKCSLCYALPLKTVNPCTIVLLACCFWFWQKKVLSEGFCAMPWLYFFDKSRITHWSHKVMKMCENEHGTSWFPDHQTRILILIAKGWFSPQTTTHATVCPKKGS